MVARPPCARDLPVHKKRPVPMVPLMAIICTGQEDKPQWRVQLESVSADIVGRMPARPSSSCFIFEYMPIALVTEPRNEFSVLKVTYAREKTFSLFSLQAWVASSMISISAHQVAIMFSEALTSSG